MESYCLVGVEFPLGEMKMWYKWTEEVWAQHQIPYMPLVVSLVLFFILEA